MPQNAEGAKREKCTAFLGGKSSEMKSEGIATVAKQPKREIYPSAHERRAAFLSSLDKFHNIVYTNEKDREAITMDLKYQANEYRLRIDASRNSLRYPPHYQRSIELVYLHEGRSTAIISEKEYPLVKDDLLIIFPHQIHGFHNDERPYATILYFPADTVPIFRDLLNSTVPDEPIVHNASSIANLTQLFWHIIVAERAESPYRDTVLCAYFTALLGQLIPLLTLSPAPFQDNNTTRDLLHYCTTHYREPLSLTSVASTLHMHPNTISAIFNRHLHTSFSDYLNGLRIEEACQRLATTQESITDIATTVGFETIRTFNRVFKQHCDITPSAYRERAHQSV